MKQGVSVRSFPKYINSKGKFEHITVPYLLRVSVYCEYIHVFSLRF